MATVEAFAIAGLKIWFWSNDHEPPHFHAKRDGEWEVRVHFLLDPSEMIEVCWSRRPPTSRTLKDLTALAEQHRERLLQQWESIHGI
ncbi:DUF4160 domain-containing protein [Maioricimonas sp. JC845]|uniref:DUF4160 domain-containing protein n=1 Tax=Maioricimonas sp. JC845 TaxID=3232138 RepID=UPI003458D097